MASSGESDIVAKTYAKMEEVEETFGELEKASVPTITVIGALGEEDASISELSPKLLTARFKRIKAELNIVENSAVPIVSDDEDVQFEIFTKELEKDILELQETYSFVCGQNKDIDNMIKKEEDILDQNKCVSEMLQNRIQSPEEENARVPDRKKEEIYQKIQNGESYLKEVVKKLGSFVDKHFPLPSQEVFSEQMNKLRSADRKLKLRDMISLKQILESLMNKCVDEPSDPYIAIDHRFWPPYIELLLRCQIALRHPDNKDRIKLAPFYL
ncbi:centromere protein K-like [Mizuhopecten yessoensis]|uniref:Centromere protein K n=1 Tax=Mizuhopecten yessoensis TaxID=6573 RepID=A0A210Q072_MIZYE|nr:centromere protein K-like [Mizuhopecten yessoensis]OWF42153.1 Centromere protein K [Mizuhopecten yessoensis]